MRKTLKRGFTIIELVIVIAVIAILAAVLIPTFASLIKKANLSADQQTVRNMNLALQAEEVADGAPTNLSEVYEILEEAGFKVPATPTETGYEFYWIKADNRVALVEMSEAASSTAVVVSLAATPTATSEELIPKEIVYPDELVKKYGKSLPGDGAWFCLEYNPEGHVCTEFTYRPIYDNDTKTSTYHIGVCTVCGKVEKNEDGSEKHEPHDTSGTDGECSKCKYKAETVPEGATVAIVYSSGEFSISDRNSTGAKITYTGSGTEYSSLEEAIQGGSDHTCVKLMNNVVLTHAISSSYSFTLDLNGYVLCSNDTTESAQHRVLNVQNGNTVDLFDSSITATGRILGANQDFEYDMSIPDIDRVEIGDGGTVEWPLPDESEDADIPDFGLIFIDNGGTFNLYSGVIMRGLAVYGGGIAAPEGGTLNMYGGTVTENTASSSVYSAGGGGICLSESSTLHLYGGTISANIADNYGGGIYLDGDNNFEMSGGKIIGNIVNFGDGGGVYMEESSAESEKTITISAGEIKNNYAKNGDGGGIYVKGKTSNRTTFHMTGGEISNNHASKSGGGLYAYYCYITLDGTGDEDNFSIKIKGNSAANLGGGIYAMGSSYGTTTFSFTIKNAEISSNKVVGTVNDYTNYGNGGGIYASSFDFTLNSGVISNNTASAVYQNTGLSCSSCGGGIYISVGTKTVQLLGGKIINNQILNAKSDGKLYALGAGIACMGDGNGQGSATEITSEITLEDDCVIANNSGARKDESGKAFGDQIWLGRVNCENATIKGIAFEDNVYNSYFQYKRLNDNFGSV